MSPAETRAPLSEQLKAYGCPNPVLLDADEAKPELVEYLDLLPRRGSVRQPLPVDAVAEHQGTALLYVVDSRSGMESLDRLRDLQHQLANRSDPAWLGVVGPGTLEIFPIEFRPDSGLRMPIRCISATDPAAPLFFQSLVHGTFLDGKKRPKDTDYVFRCIYKLLINTSSEFVPQKTLAPLDVLSLCGRALFFRFLIDRKIVLPAECADICPAADGLKDTFSSAEKAAQTAAWLDVTFNGDFLPLIDESISTDDREARQLAYLRFYRGIQRRAGTRLFDHLHAILNGWSVVRGSVQTEFDWGDLNFAHIPIGVLSQVYESFSHLDDPEAADRVSVHYTPRTLARLMVDEIFAALDAKDRARAHVLDPACGAGIFLVLAFRRLVRERWLLDGQRPDTRAIQSILYQQLCGFDVSESALRLAALGALHHGDRSEWNPAPATLAQVPEEPWRERAASVRGGRGGNNASALSTGEPRSDGSSAIRQAIRHRVG